MDDYGIGFQFLVETRAFIFAHRRDKTLWSLQHSSNKNEKLKASYLFLNTPKVISGKFREFLFYFYPWEDPANFQNRQVRTSEKEGPLD